jgi:uncharacterized protein YwqG
LPEISVIMGPEELDRQLRPWLSSHSRPAWTPTVKKSDGKITDSKFSGIPCLPDGKWPTCGSCQRPMQLFLQLDLSKLPLTAPDFGQGLLQFFFCTNETDECYIQWYGDPFAKCQCVRLVSPVHSNTPSPLPIIEDCFPAKRITGWKELEDYPAHAEREVMGLIYGSDDILRCEQAGIEIEVFSDDYFDWSQELGVNGSKLAGWPSWRQNIEYANCPICEQPMTAMVFQITCDDNMPFMLADGGVGQIIQCPEHKHSLGFVWASG